MMKVNYQWSEDGEIELCEYEECVLTEDKECYHCQEKLKKGSTVCRLVPLHFNDTYYLSLECAKNSIAIKSEKKKG